MKIKNPLLQCVCLLSALLPIVLIQPPVNAAERPASDPAAAVAQTVSQLRQIKTDDLDTDVPPAARPLLTQLKHQLRDLIQATLDDNATRAQTPSQLQTRIIRQLSRAGVRVGESQVNYTKPPTASDRYAYGDIYDILVKQPAGHPGRLAITTTIGVCCGSDTSLYLFEHNKKRWQQLLADETNGYAQVNDAQWEYRYLISPVDRSGSFFVAMAMITPWCTSNHRVLGFRIWRVQPQSLQATVIFHDSDAIFLNDEPPYKLRLIAGGFALTFDDGSYIASGTEATTATLKFLVKGNQVTKPGRIVRLKESR